ncbi:MAG TPA: glycosyltransferase family 1 protein [Gemmataceae bacterium]|jgi:glycosyltransferase involved in cell wall biosynthesis|nr:glycosyltransferase family 1 protein [Gemmataceae bacterium]
MVRIGLVCDFIEENWPSMDLVAEMLWTHLQGPRGPGLRAERVRPAMIRRVTRLPWIKKKNAAFNADRLLNRFWDYPKHLRTRLQDFDYFHICDHSYAHLVHELPADRTGVYCHDLDCFRCLLEPDHERRPRWFQAMSRRILRGMQKAAVVFCSTRITERRILQLGLIDQARLLYAPYGISPEFVPSPNYPASEASHRPGNDPFLLHVGSCIPRKRIDVLLEVFAKVRTRLPELRLVQVGGQWTGEQLKQMTQLGIASAVRQFSGLDRETLAHFYRQARIVLQPSEAEGFGLPVIEALACGAMVVASDIPVLREVGSDAIVYCPVADVPRWVATIEKLLLHPAEAPDPKRRLAQARRFSWEHHAETIFQAYLRKRKAAA